MINVLSYSHGVGVVVCKTFIYIVIPCAFLLQGFFCVKIRLLHKENGMNKRIGLIGDNSIGWIRQLIQIWNNGDCATLLDWRIPYATLIEMIREANVAYCVVEKQYLDGFIEQGHDVCLFKVFEKENSSPSLLPADIYDCFMPEYSEREAMIIYSSGTTGRAKGIILTHYAINTNADAIIEYLHLKNTDCMYLVKNIAHSSTITGELLVALKTRTPLVVASTIVPARVILKNIDKFGVSVVCLNPTLLRLLVEELDTRGWRYDISSLRSIYVHGERCQRKSISTARKVLPGINLYCEYGLSEAGPRVCTQGISSNSLDSVGKPIRDVEVKVCVNGRPVDKNTKGIVYVRTKSVFKRYVVGSRRNIQDGWLNTRDIGYWDDNDELHIIGRMDDRIIINAHKIYPTDVEQVIMDVSDIEECVVVKVRLMGKTMLACAYVSETAIDVEFRRKISKVLITYEVPQLFCKVSSLPRTRNGKVSRAMVKEIIKNGAVDG